VKRAIILVSFLFLASGCELVALGVSAGIAGISRAIDDELARRPVTQQVTQTAYVDGAALQENYRVLDADLRARGYEVVGSAQNAQLASGALREQRMRLNAGECYAVAAVGDRSVQDLVVEIVDEYGRPVEGDIASGAHPVARTCVAVPGVYTVRLLMRQGQGPLMYGAYRWTRGTRGPFGVEGLMYVRLSEATSLLATRGYEPDPQFTPVKGSLTYAGEQRDHRLGLHEGGCFILVAVGGAGVQDLDAQIDDGSSSGRSDTDRNAVVAIESCASSHARTALSIQAAQGQGEYFFQVFRRSDMPAQ
jgi:hypothetical protein